MDICQLTPIRLASVGGRNGLPPMSHIATWEFLFSVFLRHALDQSVKEQLRILNLSDNGLFQTIIHSSISIDFLTFKVLDPLSKMSIIIGS
ncbi:MAG: hypothetical protein ACFFD2_10150 [Promethearchaeota archaeon]